MIRLLPILFLILTIACIGWSQNENLTLFNSQEIDENRYGEMKGSPYFFDEWRQGKVISDNGQTYENILLNYNGYTEHFEVRTEGKYIQLDERLYRQTSIPTDVGTVVFKKNAHPDFPNKFVQVVHDGERIKLLKHFTVVLAESSVFNAGGRVEFKRFKPDRKYFVVMDGATQLVSMRKKKIKKLLGHEKEIERFAKAERIKIDTEKGLSALLTFYEAELLE